MRLILIASAAAAILGAIACATYYATTPSLPEENQIARPYPALFSDKNITQNAVEADPRFSDQTYLKPDNFLASALASLMKRKGPPSSEAGLESGTWLWTPMEAITPEYRTGVIEGAKESGIRSMYVSLDSYLDIFVLPDGEEKEAKKRDYDARVEAFLEEADQHGISVDAEGGWRNWAEPGHTYKPYALLEYVIAYNASHDLKFRGFQYDVEPYLLDDYQKDKRTILYRLVSLVDGTASRLADEPLAFSVVIPEFYDGAGKETPKFLYKFRYGTAFDHLLSVLEQKPGSSIIVMSYRNESEGENGSIAITKDEMEAAKGSSTKIIIAQETGEFPPPYITFFGKTREDLDREVGKIEAHFGDEPNYGGISVHYINALMELK